MSRGHGRAVRRRREDHAGGTERWLVSYADFITLLFAFFTVLFATSERNVKKSKEFESSVRQSFQAFIPNGTPAGPGQYTSYNKSDSMVQAPLDMYQRKQTNTSYEDEVRTELVKRLGKKNFDQIVSSTHAENNGVRISLTGSSVFSGDSSKISSSSTQQLNALADVLSTTGKRLVIEGHAEESQVKKGGYASTWDLASARATSIVRYLISKDVPADRLSAVSYADQKSSAGGSNGAGNNRVDIIVQTAEP